LTRLVFTPEIRDALVRELEAWRPREACGFLLGHGSVVRRVAPTLNAVPGLGAFAIPDHEVRRVNALADRDELLAIYHSHPSGRPALSEADRMMLRLATLPWLVVASGRLAVYAPASAMPIAVDLRRECQVLCVRGRF
jgi:[CysO sulfur-carrier protein]-S-L-cysteine hydrolase